MIPTVPWQERLWIRHFYVYLGIQLHVQKTWLVFCVCITVCLICALVQKAVCFSKIHMFGAIAVVAASRDVNNFRKNSTKKSSWRILYGGRWFNMVICSFGTEIIVTCLCFSLERRLHSFAISKKDWGMVQLELEEDVTLACICRN